MSDKFEVAPLEKFFDESTPGLRKKDGIFYTPHYASAAMTERALELWLESRGSYRDLTFGVGENSFYTNNFIKMIREWKLDGFNAYILCPHSTGKWRGSGYWINDTVINNVFSLIDKFIKDNKVDTDKIVLVGYSQGARGALYIPTKRMNFFSALVVLSAFDVPVDISVLKDVPTKGYSEGFTYMNTTFVNVFGKENYKKISVSHVELPKAVFTLDENNDNKSDVVEWMLNQKLKK